jgi:hypothetical protein
MPTPPEVFFHLGLPKTASTYLQVMVFPRLQGIRYYRKKYFRHYAEIIGRGEDRRYLFSCEFDKALEEKLRLIARDFPAAKIILVFRRHDRWIASKYKYYLRKHGHKDFGDFVDIEGTNGEWLYEDLCYRPKIELAEQLFAHPPLVLTHEALRSNPAEFNHKIESFLGCQPRPEGYKSSVVKKAYSLRQLHWVRKLNRAYPYRKLESSSRFRNRLHYRYREYLLHTMAFLGRFWPVSKGAEPLLDQKALERIREVFAEDWEYVKNRKM